ncbi:MAG: cysteine sulfinate desulfinase [Ignavibacteria bacterium GWA2_54_16]|nr:MAG: cysteine sulfinate desulfinase [Ignavibacteria bacterium GWA2_54_16]
MSTQVQIPEAVKRNNKFSVEALRACFPILQESVRGKKLVYLDNAATTQKPEVVIAELDRYYRHLNSNIHRGVHFLSEEATAAYERVRLKTREFLNAASEKEIIFVRGTTEAINLVAASFGRMNVRSGDEVLVSGMEHHSNIVPWQLLCEQSGARLKVIPINDRGEIEAEEFIRLVGPRTKIVAITHISNALGTVNPIKNLVRLAHERGVPVLVDGAQAVAHQRVDVQDLDCDFYALSSHKMYGPTGFGVLYGKEDLLKAMPPYQGGGDMIRSVTFEKTQFADLPHKFEAGTPNIADGIAFGATLDFLHSLDWDALSVHEDDVLGYATEQVSSIPGVRIIGTAREKAGVLSFVMDDIHPHDIGTILDQEGIAVRTGHHCAQPVMARYGVPATVRASFALYNIRSEVDALVRGIQKVKEVFH